MTVRKAHERQPPLWLEDYHVNATIKKDFREDADTKHKWYIQKVKILGSFKKAVKTPQKDEWYACMNKKWIRR